MLLWMCTQTSTTQTLSNFVRFRRKNKFQLRNLPSFVSTIGVWRTSGMGANSFQFGRIFFCLCAGSRYPELWRADVPRYQVHLSRCLKINCAKFELVDKIHQFDLRLRSMKNECHFFKVWGIVVEILIFKFNLQIIFFAKFGFVDILKRNS